MYLQNQKSKKKISAKFFFFFFDFRLFGEKIYFEQINLSYNETRDNI